MTNIKSVSPSATIPTRGSMKWSFDSDCSGGVLRKRILTTSMIILLILVSACGGRQNSESANDSLIDKIEQFNSSVSYEWPIYSSALETTPRTTFIVDGEQFGPVSDLFVVGKVKAVTAGNGYSWPDGPQAVGQPPTRKIHEFNSADSWMSTILLSVAVEDSLHFDDDYSGPIEITIGLFLLNPVDLNSLKTELVGKRIAAPLHSNEKTALDLEPGVFGVLRGGELLGFVDDSDNVTFPAFDHSLSVDGQPQSIKLEDLLNPPPTITKANSNGVPSGDGNVGNAN